MPSAGRIVMFVHDPTGTADPVPDVATLAALATQTPIVWPDRTGPGRTLIYEVDQAEIRAERLRRVS